VARLNVVLNGMERRVTVHNASAGDFAAADHGTWDLITFNPPLLPVPDVIRYPFVGDGGGDGLHLTRQIVEDYLPRLTPGGSMDFIGFGLGRRGHPLFVDSLAPLIDAGRYAARTLIVGRSGVELGDQAYESTVYTGALASNISFELVHSVYQQHLRTLDADEIYIFYFQILRDDQTAPRGPSVKVMRLAEDSCGWFVPPVLRRE
jgi:hypothetical protein